MRDKILKDTLCYFRVEQKYPVSISFINTLDSLDFSGQTLFSEMENSFIIFITTSPKVLYSDNPYEKQYYMIEDLKIIRHEFAHSLFNEQIGKHKYLISEKLDKMRKALNKDIYVPEELIARCIQEYDKTQAIISDEKYAYTTNNVLFLHFMEKLPSFRISNQSFNDFIPEFFNTFDADKEIERWKTLEKKFSKKKANIK